MYITQNIASRIKQCLKTQQVNTKTMLSDLDMGINTISEFSKGRQMSCISLARIADYLNCSVDYLLGRTDSPQQIYSPTVNNHTINNTLSQNYGTQIAGNSAPSSSSPSNECSELLRIYTTLPFRKQVQLLHLAIEIEKE